MKKRVAIAGLAVVVIGLVVASLVGLQADNSVASLPDGFRADLVRVEKAERKLHLLRDGKTFVSYRIALGSDPSGPKQHQGDGRTPEGRYVIDWRNSKSAFYLSLHISYPDAVDRRRAAEEGVDPGGMIMIHGQPNGYQFATHILQRFDWTDGCIAVANIQMKQIWDSVPDGTPIEILP